MADERQSAQQEAPGGRSSRGPEYGIVGEPVADTPPYDEERGPNTGEGAEGVRKSFDASNAGPPGPGAETSKEEQSGMGAADMAPEPPLGVGKHTTTGGEEHAPDRPDVGSQGPSGRPAGKAAEQDSESVGESGSVTPGSPDLQAGDQGG